MRSVKFSVVIPVYNVERYIERCLTSLKKQTFQNFEIVVVDDCGDDSSIEIVKRFFIDDVNINIVNHDANRGTFCARKTGVFSSLGEYIVFLDPDDELDIRTFELLFSAVSDSPDVVFFGSKRVPDLRVWETKAQVPSLNIDDSRDEVISKILRCKAFNRGTAGKCARRDILMQAFDMLDMGCGKRLVYGEDQLLLFSLINSANTAVSIDERLYIYHRNEGSITERLNAESLNDILSQLEVVGEAIEGQRVNGRACDLQKSFVSGIQVHKIRMRSLFYRDPIKVWRGQLRIFLITKSVKDLVKLFFYALNFVRVSR